MRRINPQEERKLTGTGTYNLDAYGEERKLTGNGAYNIQQFDDDPNEDNYSSDEFESDDDESNSSMILQDGCSGSTVDTGASGASQAADQANQQRELDRVVQAYNMILENTASEDDFEMYRPILDASVRS